jgi:hypothetical protein
VNTLRALRVLRWCHTTRHCCSGAALPSQGRGKPRRRPQ